MGSETCSRSSDQMVNFSLLSPASASVLTPRLGTLALAGRKTISTPHFVPLTSRGVVPHIAQDMLRDNTSIGSFFLGLEDFIERQQQTKKPEGLPPVFNTPTAPHESALRKFIGIPDDILTILGPRREPPITCPPANTANSIAIFTSVGFQQLNRDRYIEAIQKLKPDVCIGLADMIPNPGVKRRPKMVDRTHGFTSHATDKLYGPRIAEENRSNTAYFAPVLPLDNVEQTIYFADLENDLRPFISGLALYESSSLASVPASLGDLPRFLFGAPATPHDLLRQVSLGADLLTIPFLSGASDSGLALDFVFPSPPPSSSSSSEPLPLAFDLWSSAYATDTSPLHTSCGCYACRKHHRAYVHHLLNAKEMLAWTLLQVHNHQVLDTFFSQIRQSIQRGTFDADVETFTRAYAPELPTSTGQGPRLRGYQLPASGPAQPRRYPPVYGRLDQAAEKFTESQSSVATPDTGAEGLEERGFAEKTA